MDLLTFAAVLVLFLTVVCLLVIRLCRKVAARDHQTDYDLIIIGGGISALRTTQMLEASDPGMRILILERQDRLGGRIRRERMGNGQYVDMGAVRVPMTNTKTLALIGELDLPTTPFNPSFAGGSCRGKWYSRGRWARSAERYFLDDGGRDGKDERNPQQLCMEALRGILGTLDTDEISPCMQIRGRRLDEYSVHSLLALALSAFEIDWISNFWSFTWFKSEINAYSWLKHNLTSSDYVMVGPGFGNMFRIIEEVARRIASADIVLSANVTSARRRRSACRKRGGGGWQVTTDRNVTYTGSKLLITAPLGAIAQIDVDVPLRHRRAWNRLVLDSTVPYSLCRVYLRYETRWWKHKGTASFIDDETNQMVWLMSEGDESPVIMASYCDQPRAGASQGASDDSIMRTYHRGVCRAFGVEEKGVPLPVEYKMKYWNFPDYAIWFARASTKQADIEKARPFADLDLFLAGDSLTAMSGWIEGALMSAEAAHREITAR